MCLMALMFSVTWTLRSSGESGGGREVPFMGELGGLRKLAPAGESK